MTRKSDEVLWRLFCAGDERATEELYERYAGVLYGFALNRGLDAGEAEDLVQEVFFRSYKSPAAAARATKKGDWRSWMFKVARSIVADFYGHQPPDLGELRWMLERLAGASAQDDDREQPEMTARSALVRGLPELLDQLDLDPKVRKGLSLTPRQEQVLLLRLYGQSIAGIAIDLGISTGNVRVVLSNARKKLRAIAELVQARQGA